MGEGLDVSLRRRVDTLSEKNEAKDSARDGLGVEDSTLSLFLVISFFCALKPISSLVPTLHNFSALPFLHAPFPNGQ